MEARRSPTVLERPRDGGAKVQHRRQVHASDLLSGVIATATSLTTVAGFAISMAVLIFSGEASPGLPRAAGAFAIAGGVSSIWLALRSRVVPVATTIQDGPGMVVAALAASYAADEQTQVVDVFVLLGLTTALSGTALWLLGHFRLGSAVRCIPTTVIGGFIAGTGWLLFKGGFGVMTAKSLGLADLGLLFEPQVGRLWLPGLVLGLLAWGISQYDELPASAVGVLTLLGAAGFYAVAIRASSVTALQDGGWLIGPFPESSDAVVLSPNEVIGANWKGLVTHLPGIVGVAGLTAISTLLNVSGITTQRGNRVDLNHELRTTGIANIVTAPLCATPSFHSLGATALLDKLDVKTRAVPCAIGVTLVLVGLLGVEAIGYLPRMIPGGLLIFLGASIVQPWAKMMHQSGSAVERVLSVCIVLVIAWMGILPGIAAGLLATSAVFIVRYSRVDPVRTQGSGASHQSPFDRTAQERAALAQRAHHLAVFELQGYLFFGSLASLERKIRSRALGANPVAVIILDFRHVTGIEASATGMVSELTVELEAHGVTVILAALPTPVRRSMGNDVPGLTDRAVASLDAALAFYESWQLPFIDLRREPLSAEAPERSNGPIA